MTRGAAWRLIDTGPLDGASNMAIDEALLGAFDPQASTPVFRLYGWDPPALSLGRFQDAEAVLDLGLCRASGVPVVRRITGGGVIYHADELTYSVVLSPRQLPGETSVDGSYRRLNGFLLAFYRALGLPAAYASDSPPGDWRLGERTAFCYAGTERSDILVDGRKIGGNAQRRTRNALFQHGSIPLADRVAAGVGFMRDKPSGLDGTVADLAALGITLPVDELKDRLVAAFEETFGVVLERRQPPR